MKVVVDQSKCLSCGRCERICPEVFSLNRKMISQVIKQPTEITSKLQQAIDGCPGKAISLAN